MSKIKVTGVSAKPADSEQPPLETLKARFRETLDRTGADQNKAQTAVLDRYGAGLTQLGRAFRSTGDLDAVLALQEAVTRFDRDKALPSSTPANWPARAVEHLEKSQETIRRIEQQHLRKVVELRRLYVARLQDLKKELTRGSRFDEAFRAAAELEVQNQELARIAPLIESEAPAQPQPDAAAELTPQEEPGPDANGEPLWNGLAGYWRFDEEADARATADAGTNRYDGMPLGATFGAAGWNGNACWFDGTDDTLVVPGFTGIAGDTDRTIAFRVKAGRQSSSWPTLVHWGRVGKPGARWDVRLDSGRVRIEVEGGCVVGTQRINDRRWHSVVVVWTNRGTPDITNTTIYIDGAEDRIGETKPRAVSTGVGEGMLLGCSRHGKRHQRYFGGSLDELAVWNRALSEQEIDTLHRDGLPAPPQADAASAD